MLHKRRQVQRRAVLEFGEHTPRSPNSGSGMATAATTTATAGWVATTSSTSTALMFLPPRMMKSDVRPVSRR